MTALEQPSSPHGRVRIDPEFLLRQLPVLEEVRRGRIGWNELGIKIAHEYQPGTPKTRRKASVEKQNVSPAEETWKRAKSLIHNVMATNDPENASVRNRLECVRNPSTAALYSNLSLWLAGKMGLSLTVIQPLVALMLYGVHRASDDWNALLQ